jgi:hypothetical protein
MKKYLPAGFLCLCLLLAACGTGAPEGAASAASKAPEEIKVSAIQTADPALVVETDDFSLTMAQGWTKMDIPGGVQIYKGNDLLEISLYGINMTEDDDKASMENFIKQYNGTPIETVEMWGLQFKKTACAYNGLNQTLMTCIVGGKQFKVQTGTKSAENADTTAMINSVKLKN